MRIKAFVSAFALGLLLPWQGLAFTDVSESVVLDYLKTQGIMTGYSDGSFGSYNNINRAEFLTTVMRATGKTSGGSNCFPMWPTSGTRCTSVRQRTWEL
jgi:hypothetical protein